MCQLKKMLGIAFLLVGFAVYQWMKIFRTVQYFVGLAALPGQENECLSDCFSYRHTNGCPEDIKVLWVAVSDRVFDSRWKATCWSGGLSGEK
jgi:hypothetical protein